MLFMAGWFLLNQEHLRQAVSATKQVCVVCVCQKIETTRKSSPPHSGAAVPLLFPPQAWTASRHA